MNGFVEECRREWKRLRVPDPVADEMAADLAADLKEAEAEGVPAEEVLGSAASDPRSFAAAWAAERGYGRPVQAPRRWIALAAVVALVALAATGAALAILSPRAHSSRAAADRLFRVRNSGGTIWIAAPRAELLPRFEKASSGTTRTIGSVLLIAGLAGIVLVTVSSQRVKGV